MSKAPDLHPFRVAIMKAVEAAARRAHRHSPRFLHGTTTKLTQVDVVLELLPDAIARSGSNGRHQYAQRGLFYQVRAAFRVRMPGVELKFDYFTTIITDYENEHGDIPGLYRDNRGRFYTPRIGSKPLGTLVVAGYQRPPWMYGTVLFCEKEDHLGILQQDGFAERWDCLLVASKGFASRAARDLIDLIAATGKKEPVCVLAIHDGDAYGTLIMQALQEETKARGARSIQIIDLGLNPWDEQAQSLEHETGLLEEEEKKTKRKDKHSDRKPVADYVRTRDRHNLLESVDEPKWEEWLQDNRVELNAMTSQELIDWVEAGFTSHGIKKVIPPAEVLEEALLANLKDRINEQLREEVLRNAQAWMDEEAALCLGAIELPDADYIEDATTEHFAEQPSDHWKDVIKNLVNALAPPPEGGPHQ
jgi:DNA topoisomerase 6 subunit A-like protein